MCHGKPYKKPENRPQEKKKNHNKDNSVIKKEIKTGVQTQEKPSGIPGCVLTDSQYLPNKPNSLLLGFRKARYQGPKNEQFQKMFWNIFT